MNNLVEKYMSDAKYIISKIDNKEYCKINGQFTKHLRQHNLTYQEYYEKYITETFPKCSCGAPLTFYQKNHTYANSCGDPKCVGKTISKTKQSWTSERRITDSLNKSIAANKRSENDIAEQVAKSRNTFKQKYGVDWVTQSKNFKEKSKNTKLTRHGNEYYANSDQTSKTWQSMSNDTITEIVNKRRATCLARFGVENALMKLESRINSAKSNSIGREFILPSGNTIGIRGYEDIAITKLLKTYSEQELLIDDRKSVYTLPVFEYIDNRRHHMKYYPDIYILKENKIIEVKSQWWWDGNGSKKYKSRLENNLKKKDSVIASGYLYEVWLFTDKNNYEIILWK